MVNGHAKQLVAFAFACTCVAFAQVGPIVVSPNHHFLEYKDGTPFFWLGDTAWRLFEKLDREEAQRYLENRRQKGFTVIQAVAVHTAADRALALAREAHTCQRKRPGFPV